MSSIKRLRIFAGPNGSGKSTFINEIKVHPPSPSFKLGYYVNADEIENTLKNEGCFDFNHYGIKVTTLQVQSHFRNSTFAPFKLDIPELWEDFDVKDNCLFINKKQPINSYIAADLAEFIRQNILSAFFSFSYETVMSDEKKIHFLEKAKKHGYRIYLYYFATEDPIININRVKIRVAQQGHHVEPEIIKKRYYKSLQNLKAAIKLSDRAYLFDNSKQASVLISEITYGKNVHIIDPTNVPNWFAEYVVDNKKE